jgi:hypothetical protein
MPEIETLKEVMPPSPPEDVIMEGVDILRVALLAERKARIQADLRTTEAEERLFVAEARIKYGVDLSEYTINVDAGKAVHRKG